MSGEFSAESIAKGRRVLRIIGAVVLLLVIGGGALWFFHRNGDPKTTGSVTPDATVTTVAPAPSETSSSPTPEAVTTPPSTPASPSVSPSASVSAMPASSAASASPTPTALGRNVGEQVPMAAVAEVRACESQANVVIYYVRDTPQMSPKAGQMRRVAQDGLAPGAALTVPMPLPVATLALVNNALTWRASAAHTVFCEVREMAGTTGKVIATWGSTGTYQPQSTDWQLLEVTGYDPSLPPGPKTEASVNDDGTLSVG